MKGVSVGYPLIMTACGAIELFGALLSEQKFDPYEGRQYFVGFWKTHLYPQRPNSEAVGGALYKLLRNGIAHQFFPTGPIAVMGPRPWEHLTIEDGKTILIDAHSLANDVLAAYGQAVRPVVGLTSGSVNKLSMQTRLNEMLDEERLAAVSAELIALLPPTPATLV